MRTEQIKSDTLDKKAYDRDVTFRLTKGKHRNSWQAWINEGAGWENLRPAETTFESAQMAIFDRLIDWAFPRYQK